MNRLLLLDDCNFYTVAGDGRFIGRVREFPHLRTRPHALALDARDDIITRTRDHLAHLAGARALIAIQQRHKHKETR